MPLILALDQGTTATKALAVDGNRRIVARRSVPTPLEHPQPGWAQNDPDRIREAALEALEGVLESVDAEDVEAVGITNQRETTLAWNPSTGEPLGPAISWQCRRTEPICRRLREDPDAVETIRERTGLVVDPYFSATKMRWMLDEIKEVERAEATGELRFGTVDAFLLDALTGEHATDPSNASRTLIYDIREGAWDPELAGLLDLPMETLPEVRPSAGTFGTIDADTQLGSRLPQLEGVPVAGVAGDQQASLFGHGCLSPGEAKGTLGTGAFFLANTGDELHEPDQGIVATVAWDLGDGLTYALEGVAFSCGSVLEWAAEAGWIDDPSRVDQVAGRADGTDGVAFVPAMYGLAAPAWDPDAKAGLLGVAASTQRAQVARAILEGLAAQNAHLLEALAASGQPVEDVRVDGGVSNSDLVCQWMADAAQLRVERAEESETTALGAAGLAGLAVDVFTLEDLEAQESQPFEPEGQAAFMETYQAAVDAVTTFAKGSS